MKKALSLLLACMWMAALPAWSKSSMARGTGESGPVSGAMPANLVTISPSIYLSSVSSFGMLVGYERAVGADNSFVIQGLYQSSGPASANLSILGIGGGYRWYLLGPGHLTGLYVGPKVMLESSTYSYEYDSLAYDPVTLSYYTSKNSYSSSSGLFKVIAEAGYQSRIWSNLFAGADFELSYTSGSVSTVNGASTVTVDGTNLGSYANVGWAF